MPARRTHPRILLLSMPFGALDRPALGLSTLKPALEARRIACEVRYLNFAFADLIGGDLYQWIASDLPYTAFAGDWTFTAALYGDEPRRAAAYADEVLRQTWCRGEDDVDRVMSVRHMTGPFL